jgi:hypothetical protein
MKLLILVCFGVFGYAHEICMEDEPCKFKFMQKRGLDVRLKEYDSWCVCDVDDECMYERQRADGVYEYTCKLVRVHLT